GRWRCRSRNRTRPGSLRLRHGVHLRRAVRSYNSGDNVLHDSYGCVHRYDWVPFSGQSGPRVHPLLNDIRGAGTGLGNGGPAVSRRVRTQRTHHHPFALSYHRPLCWLRRGDVTVVCHAGLRALVRREPSHLYRGDRWTRQLRCGCRCHRGSPPLTFFRCFGIDYVLLWN
ncbi:unnamed protein product, partial [Ectocarpus fasciculatus]